jgi:ferredoxin/flavodoxin---NADP+ reductase
MSNHPPLIPSPAPSPVDIVVVGGGPVGLYAAFYAGLRRLSVKVIDAHDEVGGQLSAFYGQDPIYDIPGRTTVNASELVADLAHQAYQARPQMCLSQLVQAINRTEHGLEVVTDTEVHPAKTVVLAIGIGAIQAKPATQVSQRMYYRLAVIESIKPGHVCILGTDQRTQATVAKLTSTGWNVSVVSPHHLSDKFPHGVSLYDRHDVLSVVDDPLGAVVRVKGWQGAETCLTADCILVQAGLETSLRPLLTWDLKLEGNGIQVDSTMQTSRLGVYAVGDIAAYAGKVKLIAVGFGEAAVAINHIAHRLNPAEKVFPGYSTSVAPRRLPLFGQLSKGV